MQLYETILIISPEADDETIQQVTETITSYIESNGGELKHSDHWGRKQLAYQVKNHKEGNFIFMIFGGPAGLVSQLYRQYQITDVIIKSMIVQFEGDLAKAMEKRTPAESSHRTAPEETEQPAAPVEETVVPVADEADASAEAGSEEQE